MLSRFSCLPAHDPAVRPSPSGRASQTVAGLLLAVALVTASARAASLEPPRGVVADVESQRFQLLDEATARSIAAEAYVWSWPLAYVHQCRVALQRVPSPGRSGGMPVAPLNRLSMLTDRASPRVRGVACPNQDVIYGFGMFDLEVSPVILQVPDFGTRFWLYQVGDQRTDAFADFGSIYGTRPGCYLVVGPGWAGTAPDGVAGVVRSPTRYAYCMPRIFFSATPGDREAALPAVNRVLAYPLDEFSGEMRSCDWTKSRWLPDLIGRGRRTVGATPETFLDVLAHVLDDVPPLPGEKPLYARYRLLLRSVELDPGLRRPVEEAAAAADRDVVAPLFQFRNVGRPLPAHWTTLVNGGDFGTDYLTRTAVAKSNVFVNRHQETKYYFLDLDSDGGRLDGRREYRITFPAESLPPARGFWSLTVYDDQHALPDAAGGRHSLGSRDSSVALGEDGSLTVVVGPSDADSTPSAGPAANRLATPDGSFSLYLRLYWPARSALDGTWTPPPVHIDLARGDRSPPDRVAKSREVARSRAAFQNMAVSLRYDEFAGSSNDSTH